MNDFGQYVRTTEHAAPPGTILMAGVEIDCGDEAEHARLCIGRLGNDTATFRGDDAGTWRSEREVYGFSRKERISLSQGHLEPLWLTEWYLNGPKDMVFGRITSHKVSTSYERTREEISQTAVDGGEASCGARDHAFVDLGALSFVVHGVPSGIGPEWSRPIGIEYRKDGDRNIPPVETRRAIEEVVGFVLGRRLMRVGFTTFNAEGFPFETESANPWGDNVRATCGSCDDSPFNIQINIEGSVDIESLLTSGAQVPRAPH
jgi:hypothetical protein